MKKKLGYIPLFILTLLQFNLLLGNNNIELISSGVQTNVVKGTVVTTTGEPLIGVTVLERGTQNGTTTDLDGNYTIEISSSEAALVFSFIGYLEEVVPVGDQTIINITLIEDIQSIEEVVVLGYGTQKKVDITGSISTISTDDIQTLPTDNVTNAMVGKASGIQVVQNSGSPGSSISVKIRGTGTVNNSDPLYVVDGFIVENLDHLSTDDIADIQVLKDASSSAIYGARAANGVVIVNTKSGKNGKLKISFNSFYGISDFWNKPEMLDKHDYRAMYDESHGATLLHPTEKSDSILFYDWAVNNWLDQVSRTGNTQKYNLSVSGGSEKTKYIFSGGYSKEKGIVIQSEMQKVNARANIETNFNKIFSLRFNTLINSRQRKIIPEGDISIFKYALNESPDKRLYENSAYKFLDTDGDGGFDSLYTVIPSYRWSPFSRIWYSDKQNRVNTFQGNLSFKSKFDFGLENNFRAGYDISFTENTTFLKRHTADYLYFNEIKYDDNTFEKSNAKKTKWQIENILTFTKVLDEHTLSVLGAVSLEGYSWENLRGKKSMAPGSGDVFHSLDAAILSPITSGGNSSWKTMGFPFRFDYNYANKYYLQMNFRADASSVFASDKRWGYFPSLSAGWTLSNENFMQGYEWLSLLKIRGNWGQSGNNRINEYAASTIVETGNKNLAVYGINPMYRAGWSANGYGNPNILWEKTTAVNLGLDLNLFRNSVTSSIDFFQKNTSDMLLRLPLVHSYGMSSTPWQNAGEVQNLGFEATLGVKRTIGKFSLGISGNFTKIMNKVTRLGEDNNPVLGGNVMGDGSYVTYTQVGQPIGMFYGWKIDRSKYPNGIWHEEDRDIIPNSAVPNPDGTEPGDFIFMDLNGDNKIDENDKTFLGNPHPDFTYGLTINLKYGNFDFTAFFQGVYGNDLFNVQRNFMYNYTGDNNVAKEYYGNTYTTDNQDAPYPEIGTQDNNTQDLNENFRVSDFYIEDGSFLRLKNLQVGYNFPKSVVNKLKMGSLRVYVGGGNLITFTNYTGFDPEIGADVSSDGQGNTNFGIDRGVYPQARTFVSGLIMNF